MDWNFFLKVIGSLAIALLIFVGIVYVVGVPKELKSKAEVQVAEGLGEGAIKDALQGLSFLKAVLLAIEQGAANQSYVRYRPG